jgi:ribosomal protein L40E
MQYCIHCGSELLQAAKFCAKCGRKVTVQDDSGAGATGSQSKTMPESATAHFNYDEFGFCRKCDAVNLIVAPSCRACGAAATMRPLPGDYIFSHEFWAMIVIGIIGILTVAAPLLVGVRIVYMIRYRTVEQRKARESILREAQGLFDSLKRQQASHANKQIEEGLLQFNKGNWKDSHDLFVNSMVLSAVIDPEQALGAAVTAYNGGDYKKALEYADKMNGNRLDVLYELKAS